MAEKTTVKTIGAQGVKTLAKIMARYDAATLQATKEEITSSLADFYSKEEIDEAISEIKNNVKAEIIGGASEDYDTLKEIADYIEEHGEVTEALNAAIGDKASKETVENLETRVATIEDADYLSASDIAVFTDAEIEALVAEALAEAE